MESVVHNDGSAKHRPKDATDKTKCAGNAGAAATAGGGHSVGEKKKKGGY